MNLDVMTECQYSGRRCFQIPSSENLGLNQCPDHVEPDGHVYVRCEYFSNRTRIRCSSVRRAKELKFHGFCEKHNGFIERLRREAARARRILDPGCMVDDGQDVNCSSDEFDEALEVSDEKWPFVFESLYCDTRIDNPDNPLRNAGCFTSKEIVRQYVDAVERHKESLLNMRIIYAEQHRRLLADRARQRRNADTENKRPLLDSKNAPSKNKRLRERYRAYTRYGSYLRWRRSRFFAERLQKRNTPSITPTPSTTLADNAVKSSTSNCQHIERVNLGRQAPSVFDIGKSAEGAENSVEIDDLLHRMIDYVDLTEQPSVDVIQTTACDAPRIPLSDFCTQHVLTDENQQLFSKCVECECPAMFFSEYRRCRVHFDKLIFNSSRSSTLSTASSLPTHNVIICDDLDAEVYLKMCADMVRAEPSPTRHYNVARPTTSADKLLMMPASGAVGADGHHGHRPAGYSYHLAGAGDDSPHYGPPHGTFRPMRYQPKLTTYSQADRESSCARVRPFSGNHGNRRLLNASPAASPMFTSPRQLGVGGPPIISPRGHPSQQPSIVYAAHASPSSSQYVYSSSKMVGESYVSSGGGMLHHPERSGLHHPPPLQQPTMHVLPRRISSQMSIVAQPSSAYPYPIAAVQRRQPPATESMIVGRSGGGGRMPAVRIMHSLPAHRGMPTARRGHGVPRDALLQSQRHLPSSGQYQQRHP